MSNNLDRRSFMKTAGMGMAASALGVGLSNTQTAFAAPEGRQESSGMKLGMVTYNMGKDMSCDELIELCKKSGLEGVELRTTHAHKVEVNLSASERAAVKKKFEDSGILIAGLGSAFEFHADNERVLQKNIEGAIEYAKLAADVGAPGIKVRPNRISDGEDPEVTYERIGKAWGKVAAAAADVGVDVRMEVHGAAETRSLKGIRKMLDHANHPNAVVCWNSNGGEEDENGSIKANFDLVKDSIGLVHITEIGVYQYPWQELFSLLKSIDYSGFCLAEIQYNPQPERFMRYYRTLFDLYTGKYNYPNPDIYKEA